MAVVQNGIIENYRTLREELQADGVVFRSATDTEVIPIWRAASCGGVVQDAGGAGGGPQGAAATDRPGGRRILLSQRSTRSGRG